MWLVAKLIGQHSSNGGRLMTDPSRQYGFTYLGCDTHVAPKALLI